jgi:hypothetical protein
VRPFAVCPEKTRTTLFEMKTLPAKRLVTVNRFPLSSAAWSVFPPPAASTIVSHEFFECGMANPKVKFYCSVGCPWRSTCCSTRKVRTAAVVEKTISRPSTGNASMAAGGAPPSRS